MNLHILLLNELTKSSPHVIVMFWLSKSFNPLTRTSVNSVSAVKPMSIVSGTEISLFLELSVLVTSFLYCLMMFTMASKELSMESCSTLVYSFLLLFSFDSNNSFWLSNF